MKIKINKPLINYKIGQIIDIKTDNSKIPLSLYWRRRLKDAEIDNCIEIVEERKIQSPAVKSTKEKEIKKVVKSVIKNK
jgi:hypothetical protein